MRWIFLAVIGLSLAGCSQDDGIQVYRLAKDADSEPDIPVPEVVGAGIAWTKPDTWREMPASGMRKGSFIADHSGSEVDISAIFLEGVAGGDLPNVNRWRQQLSLEPWSAEVFSTKQVTLTTQLGESRLVDFQSDDQRMVAAILPYQHGTWFFKMLGPVEPVGEERARFDAFVRSVRSL
jgi:hypothetical protein